MKALAKILTVAVVAAVLTGAAQAKDPRFLDFNFALFSPTTIASSSVGCGQAVYPQPVYTQPVYPQPVYPQPVYPQPVYPQAAYPQPVCTQPVYTQPVCASSAYQTWTPDFSYGASNYNEEVFAPRPWWVGAPMVSVDVWR